MLDFIKDKKDCVGCTACLSVCPIKCIRMIRDSEGFYYPEATNACIKCGKCEQVCPVKNINRPQLFDKQIVYAAVSKSKSVWKRSASGGAFTEICRAWNDGDTMFVGARWDGFKVIHDCVIGIDNIAPLCNSKYVASDLRNSFNIIKQHLDSGKRAVFSGTPCQIAGLKKYLNKEYENLLLVDFICHGVGSQSVFEDSIGLIERDLDVDISGYEFRSKDKVYENDHIQKIKISHKKVIRIVEDRYIQLFLSQKCLRPSCGENCLYRNEQRQGDITIADFKGLKKVFPQLAGTKKNYSTIVLNSKKGLSINEILNRNMKLFSCSIDEIKKYNPLYFRQTHSATNERNEFFDIYSKSKEEAISKYTVKTKLHKRSFIKCIWFILPECLRTIVIRFRGL